MLSQSKKSKRPDSVVYKEALTPEKYYQLHIFRTTGIETDKEGCRRFLVKRCTLQYPKKATLPSELQTTMAILDNLGVTFLWHFPYPKQDPWRNEKTAAMLKETCKEAVGKGDYASIWFVHGKQSLPYIPDSDSSMQFSERLVIVYVEPVAKPGKLDDGRTKGLVLVFAGSAQKEDIVLGPYKGVAIW